MSDLARDLIKDSYTRIESNKRRRRLTLILSFFIYVILYVPLVHLSHQSEAIRDSLSDLAEEKVDLSVLGEEITRANNAIHNASESILKDFVSRLRDDFACLKEAIRSVRAIRPGEIPGLEGRLTENCSVARNAPQYEQQQRPAGRRGPAQRQSLFGPDPSFPANELVRVFGQPPGGVSEEAQTEFIEEFLVEPRLAELNSIWKMHALPSIQKGLSAIASRLEESDRKGETWTADYEQIVANLRNARSELSRFEFSGSRSTGAHPWWRSVEGKEDYAGFELDRVDETFGVPQVVDEALARLEALEDARTAELGDIETQITKLNEQLKATMNLLGGDVGAGAYLSLPIASIAPTLPMVLGVLFAAFLADASEERRRFEEQLNAFARSSADDADFIRAILGERRTTTIPLAGALAGTWIAHAAYEAYRLDPESLTTTGSSVGIGLALLMAAVFLAMSRRVHKSR